MILPQYANYTPPLPILHAIKVTQNNLSLFVIFMMQYVSNAPLWIINGNDGKSLPLNSPRPSGLLATSQTHWASWAQCWEDTPPELCWSPSSHTASKCGETSPPAGRQENSRVTIQRQQSQNSTKQLIFHSYLESFPQPHAVGQNTAGARRLLHLLHWLTTAVPHELNTCKQKKTHKNTT